MLTTRISRALLVLALLLSLMTSLGCSKSSDGQGEDATIPSVSQQALDATRDYRNNTMKGAQKTQTLGDERTQAIDKALRQ